MHIPVPITYHATVRTRSGDHVDRRYREVLNVEVATTTGSHAPPVLRWQGYRPLAEWPGGPCTPVLVRCHEGRLYEPVRYTVTTGDGARHIRHAGAGDLAAIVSGDLVDVPGEPALLARLFDQDAIRASLKTRLKGPPKVGAVVDSRRGEAVREIDSLAKTLLFVDGRLHRAVPEPVLRLTHRGLRVVACDEVQAADQRHVFRLDDRDAAIAHAVAHHGLSTVMVDDYDLIRPTALRHAPEAAALMASAQALLRHVGPLMTDLPVPAMAAFCDLQEAVDLPDADQTSILERARALCALVEEARPESRTVTRVIRHELARAEGALELPEPLRPR